MGSYSDKEVWRMTDTITDLRAQVSALEHDLDKSRGHAQEYLNELEPLRARVKELEGERDKWKRDYLALELGRYDRAEAAESEARRLREALQYIALRGDETAMAAIHHTPEGSAG